uniref:Uncharacterized protein n=1 Tax=viral metagenome TaxID=1070528 RepID=A0A6M3IM65_9ZZZZ
MIEEKKDVKFEKDTKSAADKRIEEQGLPVYMEKLELSDAQKSQIIEECLKEIDEIKKEREADQLEDKWEALDNQYDGKISDDDLKQFNLNRNVTKVKIDAVVLGIKEALLDSDPIFAVTPRPNFGKTTGMEVCNKQQDFLDYKVDNLPFEPEIDLVAQSAAVKGLGWLELYYDIKREPRKRDEEYEPEMIPVIDKITQRPVLGPDQKTLLENKGLRDFLNNWPNAVKDYPGYVKQLSEGKKISFVATSKEKVYDDPRPKYHDIKDVYARAKTDGYEGLKTTRLIAVKENFTYWELKKEEADSKFYDINKLVEDKDGKKPENYLNKDFDIWKCTYYFKLNKNDKEETKVIVWFEENKKVVIGSILYPYYAVACCYIPFTIKRKKKGLYQPGIAEDLTDSNLAENAILNLTLEGAWIQNTITPITKDSAVHAQFLEKRFIHGLPIEGDAKNIDFLQKYMQPINYAGLLQLMQYMILGDDQVSRVSSLMSGAESPIDPTAPARKTLELLRQSGRGVLDYVKIFSRSFNEVGYTLLNLYYQMSKQGREYSPRPENVVGDNPFSLLTRNDMIARTNIQSRSFMFEQDKVNEKTLDLALYQTIRQEPLVAKNPEAVYTLLKNLVDSWSLKWKNISDKVIPTLSDFKKMELQTALQAVSMYVQGVVENSKVTGVAPEFDLNQLMPIIADLQAQLVTPPDPNVVKEQERRAKQQA